MAVRLSEKERSLISILEALNRGEISQKEAAAQTHLSTRQIRRKIKRFREQGEAGLVHRSRGKPSPRRFNPEMKKKILQIISTSYAHLGPTEIARKLKEEHNITIIPQTLRLFMIESGIWKQRERRHAPSAAHAPSHTPSSSSTPQSSLGAFIQEKKNENEEE